MPWHEGELPAYNCGRTSKLAKPLGEAGRTFCGGTIRFRSKADCAF